MSARQKIRSILPLLLTGLSAFAADPASLEPQGYVSDFAGVVSGSDRQSIERYCAQVEKATGAQLALVTVRTLDGAPIEDFAADLFRRWGVGKKSEDNGVLLLLATDDRHSRLEVGRGLEPTITDGTAGTLLREMRPALRGNDFAEALRTAAHSLGDRIAAAKGVTIAESAPERRRPPPQEPSDGLPIPIIIGVVVLVLLFFGRGRGGGGGFLPGMILGNMLSRSSYGRSGGGFGGYDSGGGGFGGFGGGDSGGGGASSNW